MDTIKQILLLMTALIGAVSACNKGQGGGGGYGGNFGGGWGQQPLALIALPQPTLIPKLKHAYLQGKLSVDYHKIVAPSLKPLPYKKGHGFVSGWQPTPGVGIYNDQFLGLPPRGFGKARLVGVKGQGGGGWGKGQGGGGWGKGPVYQQPQVHTVTPFAPPAHGWPAPAPFLPHPPPQSHHSVHQTVSVVQRGHPHNFHDYHGK